MNIKAKLASLLKRRVEKDSPTTSQVHVNKPLGEEDKIKKDGYSGDALLKVAHAELVTFPNDVPGSNCANCKYQKDNECHHPLMGVQLLDGAEKMCCDYWDHEGTKHWGEDEEVSKADRRIATVAIKHGNHLLMGKRRDNQRWTVPGGHVDPEEDMHQGALREVEEESGLKLDHSDLKPLSDVQNLKDHKGEPVQVQPFHVQLNEKPKTTMKEDPDAEVHRWQWVDVSDGLPEHIKNNLHVPAERNTLMHHLGLVDKGEDGNADLATPPLDNLEAEILKAVGLKEEDILDYVLGKVKKEDDSSGAGDSKQKVKRLRFVKSAKVQAQEAVEAAFNPPPVNPPAPHGVKKEEEKSSRIEKMLKSGKIVPIFKKNSEKQIVYGVVLEPDTVDAQEDVITAEEIEKTAHDYLQESRVVGTSHTKPITATPVESFIAPVDFNIAGQYGPQLVLKGSWVLGVKVHDPKEWEKVKSGDYTGFSVGGLGARQAM